MSYKPDICIYHSSCPDGFTSAWAVWKRYGSEVVFHPGKYGEAPPDVIDKHVLLVDFSYKRDVILTLVEKAKTVTILDHHKSAQEDISDLLEERIIDGVFDMDRSGAGISWDWCHEGKSRPPLVSYVEDRDLWRFRYSSTENFCAWLDMQEMTFERWDQVAAVSRDTDDLNEILAIGECLVAKFNKDADRIIKSTTRFLDIAGHRVPVCNAPYVYASRIGNILASRDDAPFGASYYTDDKGFHCFSLRSLKTKEDVSRIASSFGGGGHREASGFRIAPENMFKPAE